MRQNLYLTKQNLANAMGFIFLRKKNAISSNTGLYTSGSKNEKPQRPKCIIS